MKVSGTSATAGPGAASGGGYILRFLLVCGRRSRPSRPAFSEMPRAVSGEQVVEPSASRRHEQPRRGREGQKAGASGRSVQRPRLMPLLLRRQAAVRQFQVLPNSVLHGSSQSVETAMRMTMLRLRSSSARSSAACRFSRRSSDSRSVRRIAASAVGESAACASISAGHSRRPASGRRLSRMNNA